jgi:hypothetical protein
MDFNKAIMHNVPTYDEMVRETITHTTDKIELPDIMATPKEEYSNFPGSMTTKPP